MRATLLFLLCICDLVEVTLSLGLQQASSFFNTISSQGRRRLAIVWDRVGEAGDGTLRECTLPFFSPRAFDRFSVVCPPSFKCAAAAPL